MRRILFGGGGQKDFLDLVIARLNSPSLRGILQFGVEMQYSTLRNYYSGSRLLPEDLFDDLLEISGIDLSELSFDYAGGSWGQVKGGKKGKRPKAKI